MIPGKYSFKIYKGSRLNHKITATDKDGLAVDFSKYTSMRMQVRPLVMYEADGTVPAPLIELTTANGGITTDIGGTTLYIKMSATATAALDFAMGKYDLELVGLAEDADAVDTLLYGTVAVIPEVTV